MIFCGSYIYQATLTSNQCFSLFICFLFCKPEQIYILVTCNINGLMHVFSGTKWLNAIPKTITLLLSIRVYDEHVHDNNHLKF